MMNLPIKFLKLTAAAALFSGSASAAIVFTEDFESPDVTSTAGDGNTNGTLPDNGNWVGATEGFGASRRGITDKAGGDFSAADPNQQAFAFRYTNSGLTSAEGVISSLTAGLSYTVSFDVVMDEGGGDGTPYVAQLVAFPSGAARNDVRPAFTNFTLLDSASGDATGDGNFTTVTINFTPDNTIHAADFGKDVGIRFLGATASAIIDNVSVDVVPEPSAALFLVLGGLSVFVRRRR